MRCSCPRRRRFALPPSPAVRAVFSPAYTGWLLSEQLFRDAAGTSATTAKLTGGGGGGLRGISLPLSLFLSPFLAPHPPHYLAATCIRLSYFPRRTAAPFSPSLYLLLFPSFSNSLFIYLIMNTFLACSCSLFIFPSTFRMYIYLPSS